MTDAPHWAHGDVETPTLNAEQVKRVVAMNKMLRESWYLLDIVAGIKQNIAEDDITYAMQLWAELSDEEQTAVWIAPRYGGLFTTAERKIIQESPK